VNADREPGISSPPELAAPGQSRHSSSLNELSIVLLDG
jgi:hypothetical protein